MSLRFSRRRLVFEPNNSTPQLVHCGVDGDRDLSPAREHFHLHQTSSCVARGFFGPYAVACTLVAAPTPGNNRNDDAEDNVIPQRNCARESQHEWRDDQPYAQDHVGPTPARLTRRAQADQREYRNRSTGGNAVPCCDQGIGQTRARMARLPSRYPVGNWRS